jgi:hypothetical protein
VLLNQVIIKQMVNNHGKPVPSPSPTSLENNLYFRSIYHTEGLAFRASNLRYNTTGRSHVPPR